MNRILILTPIYKRPEIFELFLKGYERIRHQADLLIIRSITDPYYDINMALIMKHKIRSIEYSNDNLGDKKNAGLNYALDNIEFDYLMDLGSDNILNPSYIPSLFPRPDTFWKNPIGLKHLYIWDHIADQFYFIKNYAYEHTYGAGRLYHRKLLKMNFWPSSNAGLDIGLINKHKFTEDVFYLGELPYLLDIKTRTNINPMDLILSRKENRAKLIQDQKTKMNIKKIFGI